MRSTWWTITLAILTSSALLAGCSDRDPVTQPPETPGGEILDPVPDGMPLPGDPEDPATDALVNLAPSPVPASQVQDALLTTRLRAILDPDATVQQVNEALAGHDAAIVSMTRGVPIVVLVIDPVADLAEAEARAAALAQTPAFLAVFPARSFTAPASEGARHSTMGSHNRPAGELEAASRSHRRHDAVRAARHDQANANASAKTGASPTHTVNANRRPSNALAFELPEGIGDDGPADHLVKTRVPAAWNVRDLNSADVTVLIADHFPDRSTHSGIDPLEFSFYGGFGNDAYNRNGTISGNEGIHSAGIIGGNWDTELPGIHPGSRLRIVGIPLGGLDLWEVSSAIYDVLSSRAVPDRTVLLTGLTYREADMEDLGALERASLALGWRLLVRSQARDFESDLLHIVPGGDRTEFDGPESPLGTDTSYWSVAARYADLRTYLLSLDPTDDEVQNFDALIEDTGAAARSPLDNVLIIGGSKADGSPLPNGALLTDVRTYGEFVKGPCVLVEEAGSGVLCDGTSAAYVGTFAAAPQVAGLGAYLWSLAPTRTSLELRDVLTYSYHGGFVDAYRSVLALDPNLIDPRIRETLLDPNEDGRFDEADIEEFRDEFAAYQRFRELGYDDPDFSRYDLNGDGYTGSDAGVPFDLDADRSFGSVAVDELPSSFDESASSDLDVLCYCAYSDLYFGDPDDLANLLPECGEEQTGLFVQLTGVPERADPGQEVELTVTVGYNGSDQPPLEGISISFDLDGADAEPYGGETDASGTFRTTLTYGEDDNEFVIGVWAETEEEEVYTEQTTLRNDSIEFVERYVYAASEILSVYAEEGKQGEDLIREYSYVEAKGDASIDTTLTESGSGQGQGMIVSGSARTTLKAEVELDGDNFSGSSFSSESRGSVTLTNPNFDLLLYQVEAEGLADVTIDFIVWGEPASFNLDGAVSSADYVVDLDGPGGTVFECSSGDAPCASIAESGTLPPGPYSLTINHVNGGRVYWNTSCTDCQSSGTSEQEGTLDVEFSISH